MAAIIDAPTNESFLSGEEIKNKSEIQFANLNLVLSTKKGKKVILDNLSGTIKPGRFTALMGPSGSGKTSLLNALAGRTRKVKGLSLTGLISVNGVPVESWSDYRRLCGYVEQDDLLFHTLTVRETLQLAADLRLPREMTSAEKKARVEAVLNELGLRKCADTRIGNERMRGVSGGERKRVSVGLEILRGPSVLFLDECTTGLDSFQALRVASTIKDLASQGRTMVSSIHQPRSSIFSLFDDIAVLSEGKVMYFGEAKKMVEYFNGLGYAMPEHFNPADFILDLVSVDMRSEELEKETKQRLKDIGTSFVARPEETSLIAPFEENPEDVSESGRKYESSRVTQFWLLSKRNFRQRARDILMLVIPFVTTSFFSLLLGFLYFQTGSNLTQAAILDKVGSLFFLALNQWMSGMFSTLSVFPKEKQIVNRERSSKSYALSPYYLSKVLVDLPMIFFPTLFTVLFYFTAGYRADAGSFFATLLMTVLAYECAVSFGMFLSAFANSMLAAQGIAMPIMLIFILFSGFYANNDVVPAALNWIQWISPIRWIFSGVMVVQFRGLEFTCDPSQPSQGCTPTGDFFLQTLGLQDDSFARSMGILLGMTGIFHCLAYISLRVKKIRWVVPRKKKN